MPQIDLLLSLIGKVWTTNIKIIDMLIKLNDKISEPDTRHTYLQQPVRVEDGLGRLLIIPSEWDMGVSTVVSTTWPALTFPSDARRHDQVPIQRRSWV